MTSIPVYTFLLSMALHSIQSAIVKKTSMSAMFSVHDIILYRSIVVMLLLLPYIVFSKNFLSSFKRNIKLNLTICCLSSASSYLWHIGCHHIDIDQASFLTLFIPSVTIIITHLLKIEKINSISSITNAILLIIFTITFYIATILKISINIGYAYIIFDILIYSMLIIYKKRISNNQNTLYLIFNIMVFNTIISLIMGLLKIVTFSPSLFKANNKTLILIASIYMLQLFFSTMSYRLGKIQKVVLLRFLRLPITMLTSFIFFKTPFDSIKLVISVLTIIILVVSNNLQNKKS